MFQCPTNRLGHTIARAKTPHTFLSRTAHNQTHNKAPIRIVHSEKQNVINAKSTA